MQPSESLKYNWGHQLSEPWFSTNPDIQSQMGFLLFVVISMPATNTLQQYGKVVTFTVCKTKLVSGMVFHGFDNLICFSVNHKDKHNLFSVALNSDRSTSNTFSTKHVYYLASCTKSMTLLINRVESSKFQEKNFHLSFTWSFLLGL